jgi:hypothetical protein
MGQKQRRLSATRRDLRGALVVTELGQGDCSDQFIRPLLDWLDTQKLGYLAWAWNAYGPCQPRMGMQAGQPWSLVVDYASGMPNGAYTQAYHDHLMMSTPATDCVET